MRHTLQGETFHGQYNLTLVGPKDGFYLSPYQVKKYASTLCPFFSGDNDCQCGGNYGSGPDFDFATIIHTWDKGFMLIPSPSGRKP